MNNAEIHFAVLAIPLSRPAVVQFLSTKAQSRTAVAIIAQRPTLAAQKQWLTHLAAQKHPTIAHLLRIDDPHNYLHQTTTDRLVPAQFLRENGFLTRNLGGWHAAYFGIFGLPRPWPPDPMLDNAQMLADYGPTIRYFGADPALVAARLETEMGQGVMETAVALQHLAWQRPATTQPNPSQIADYIELVYAQIISGRHFATATQPPIPRPLLLDELLDWLTRLELRRRHAEARGDQVTVEQIAAWQHAQRDATGLLFILKGEYIVGRHRRSTVLIAPELGVVIKQPGPEPFHEIQLNAQTWRGQPENWPYLTHDQSLVTPRGRIRQVLEEGLIPRLHKALHHPMQFYSLLGLTVEPFVAGPTTQALVLGDPVTLTPQLYETYIFHQQVAEALGVENGDWHSANFVVRQGDGEIVHIDWGAARPLRPEELTPVGKLARLNQVQNIAYSFHDAGLATRVTQLHTDLLADGARLAHLQARARTLVDQAH